MEVACLVVLIIDMTVSKEGLCQPAQLTLWYKVSVKPS